ncbi:cation transporter [Niallia sp. FSL R7-0271]|uniref:cation transporter n=1 Tax=Niallia sp. FSL R7-0271 TaxID=2921678 RepID=UPI0030F59FF3
MKIKVDVILERTILNVKGMSCGHCVNLIEGCVGELRGVPKVKVYSDKGTVDVEFNNKEVH